MRVINQRSHPSADNMPQMLQHAAMVAFAFLAHAAIPSDAKGGGGGGGGGGGLSPWLMLLALCGCLHCAGLPSQPCAVRLVA